MPDSNQPIGSAATAELKPAAPAAEASTAELRAALPLSADELARAARPSEVEELLGQERAMSAVRLAIGIDAPGYNVFVSGLRTRHERESILRLLRERAAAMPTPGDWVYVHNFVSSEAPAAIYLAPGQGHELKARMTELVNFVLDQLPKAFRRAPRCATSTTSARRSCSPGWSSARATAGSRSRARRPASCCSSR